MRIEIKRIYETPNREDGLRVFVDRLWPRGLKKGEVIFDIWARGLAPSSDLRRWFGHEGEKFQEFTQRYHAELAARTDEAERLIEAAGDGTITLLFAAKNQRFNHAIVLRKWLTSLFSKRSVRDETHTASRG